MSNSSGRRGQMSRSVSLGASDPRARRGPQEALTDLDLKLPLKLTKDGQISIDLAGALTVNPDGTISINTSNGITTAPGSPLSIQLNIDDDSLEITPDKKVRARPRFSQIKVDQRDVREVTGRNLAEVIDNETELIKRRGAADGYASLDSTGKVPAAQLPATAIPATIPLFAITDVTFEQEVVRFDNGSGSAVNSLSLANSDTGNAVTIASVGSDTNVDINVAPQGTGKLRVNSSIVETQGNKGVAGGYAGLDGSTLLSVSQLPIFTSTLAGAVSGSGGGTTNFLRADGTWAAPSGGGGVTDHGLLTGLADDDHAQYVLADGTRSGWPTPTTASAANGVPKADANGRISKNWLPEASIDDFLKAGTTNYTAFYAAGAMTGTALSNWALTANRLYAIPFLSPRRGAVIDQLSAYVSTGAASTNIRFGLYNNKSESELYPDTLFYDAGAFTSTTTNQSRDATGLALTLEPSKIYWAVIVGDGTPSLRAVAAGGGSYVMGLTATNVGAHTVGLYATFTYGALPATFPTAGFTASTNTHPTLFYKLSS